MEQPDLRTYLLFALKDIHCIDRSSAKLHSTVRWFCLDHLVQLKWWVRLKGAVDSSDGSR